jgi:hypothetical protein
MRTELESRKGSARIARQSALRWGHAMKNPIYFLLVIAMMAVGAAVEAQSNKIPRIGFVTAGSGKRLNGFGFPIWESNE